MAQDPIASERRLSLGGKLVFSLGDHTVNVAISAATLLYLPFLTEYGELRPLLAGFVVWTARLVDAVTDPLMGRISDLTRWRGGRRRPYFLIGALPFGICFALMWTTPPFEAQLARAAYYAAVYIGVSVSMTVLSVPYLALLPEMAPEYDERTSLNTFRAAAAVLGSVVAVGMKTLSDALGSGASSWAMASGVVSLWLVIPWLAVHRVSFERPSFQRDSGLGFVAGMRLLAKHRAYRSLCGLYICGRIAVDLIGAMFLLYFVHWIGRGEDFDPTLVLFLGVTVLSLPLWLHLSKSSDKRTIFIIGASWWIGIQCLLFAGGPSWPRWIIFSVAALAAIGYAVADLMPWAMLGEVVDEDELSTGERREGVYVGFFTFLRKLGGATAVLIVGLVLDLTGYRGGVPREAQSELALETIRWLMSLVPAVFLAFAIRFALGYPLTRAVHEQVVARLRARRSLD